MGASTRYALRGGRFLTTLVGLPRLLVTLRPRNLALGPILENADLIRRYAKLRRNFLRRVSMPRGTDDR